MPKIVDHDERRRHIVDALWRVVNRDGASEVSVRHVAAEAGMPKSSIGHYVGTMPQLLGLAVDELIQQVTDEAISLDLFDLDTSKVVDVLSTLIPVDKERRNQSGIWLIVLSQAPGDPEVAAVLERLNGAFYETIVELLTMMTKQGLMAEDREITLDARRLHALVDGLSMQSLNDAQARSRADIRAILQAEVAALASPAHASVN